MNNRTEIIGDAELHLADCRDVIPTRPVDCIMTSPPYNTLSSINAEPTGLWRESDAGAGFVKALRENGYADDRPEDEYQAEQNSLFQNWATICSPTASLFYNHQIRWRDKRILHPIEWFHPLNWFLRSEIVWDRGGGMMFNARMFCRFDERLLWFTRSLKWKWNSECVGLGTVWRIARAQHKEHPVAFPLEIPHRCIASTTERGDTVFDPYMGSGTTAIATLNLGRKFIGVEREERYFDVACQRIERETRQMDMLIHSNSY